MMILLAEREFGGWYGRWWAKESVLPPEVLITIFGVVGFIVLIYALLWVVRKVRTKARPLWLFNRVAGRLGVGVGDRLWLWRIARRTDLMNPITLLLSPATLEHHVEATLGGGASRAFVTRRRMEQVRDRLFGDPPVVRDADSGGQAAE